MSSQRGIQFALASGRSDNFCCQDCRYRACRVNSYIFSDLPRGKYSTGFNLDQNCSADDANITTDVSLLISAVVTSYSGSAQTSALGKEEVTDDLVLFVSGDGPEKKVSFDGVVKCTLQRFCN